MSFLRDLCAAIVLSMIGDLIDESLDRVVPSKEGGVI